MIAVLIDRVLPQAFIPIDSLSETPEHLWPREAASLLTWPQNVLALRTPEGRDNLCQSRYKYDSLDMMSMSVLPPPALASLYANSLRDYLTWQWQRQRCHGKHAYLAAGTVA